MSQLRNVGRERRPNEFPAQPLMAITDLHGVEPRTPLSVRHEPTLESDVEVKAAEALTRLPRLCHAHLAATPVPHKETRHAIRLAIRRKSQDHRLRSLFRAQSPIQNVATRK
jgi:hypothetical protein